MSTRETLRAIRGNVYGAQGQGATLDVPRCSIYRTGALNIATGTGQAIPWDTREYDTDGMTAVSASTGFYITARTQGLYAFNAWGLWAFNATSFRELQFSKNGGAVLYGNSIVQPSGGVATGQQISAHIPLNAGDYVSLVASQSTAGNVAWTVATAADRANGFQACLISTIN